MINDKLIVWSFLQDNPLQLAPEQTVIRDFYVALPKGIAHSCTPCWSWPQIHWLASYQTTLQKQHTEGEQINSDAEILGQMPFMGPAPKHNG